MLKKAALGAFYIFKKLKCFLPRVFLIAVFYWFVLCGLDRLAYAGHEYSIQAAADSKGILLHAERCEKLLPALKSISQWKMARGESVPGVDLDCKARPDLRDFEITHLVPTLALELHGRDPFCEGPNCWNAALYEARVLPHLRFSDSSEFAQILGTQCQLRGLVPGDLPYPGDIAAIRERTDGRTWKEVHGFIFVGPLSFSKNDMGKSSPWRMRTLAEEHEAYGYMPQPECESPDLSNIPASCYRFVSYYHCNGQVKLEHSPLGSLDEFVSDCTSAREGMKSPVDLLHLDEISDLLEQVRVTSPALSPTVESLGRQFQLTGAELHVQRYRGRSMTSPETLAIAELPEFSMNPFEKIIENGDLGALKEFLESGGDINRIVSPEKGDGRTALHLAVLNKDFSLLRWLLRHGADRSRTDSEGRRAEDGLVHFVSDSARSAFQRVFSKE